MVFFWCVIERMASQHSAVSIASERIMSTFSALLFRLSIIQIACIACDLASLFPFLVLFSGSRWVVSLTSSDLANIFILYFPLSLILEAKSKNTSTSIGTTSYISLYCHL